MPFATASWMQRRDYSTPPALQTSGNHMKLTPYSIETVSGNYVDLSAPTVDMIAIEDIAWGCSRQPRFAGHTITEIPYSVAQHSCFVVELIAKAFGDCSSPEYDSLLEYMRENGYWADGPDLSEQEELMVMKGAWAHDGSEAYLVDLPSPIKRLPGLGEAYKKVESEVMDVIHEKLRVVVTPEASFIIGWADLVSRAIEAYHFMPSRGLAWNLQRPTLLQLHTFQAPLKAVDAYKMFLSLYEELFVMQRNPYK